VFHFPSSSSSLLLVFYLSLQLFKSQSEEKDCTTMSNATPTRSQLTDTVLMIAPVEFGFNEQTADDNVFQVEAKDLTSLQLREKALTEFRSAVEELRKAGIRVLDLREPVKSSQPTPDAVFPNNWISTTQSGSVIVYVKPTPCRGRVSCC